MFYGYDFIMILPTQSSFMIMTNYAYCTCIVKGHSMEIAFHIVALHENAQNSTFPLNMLMCIFFFHMCQSALLLLKLCTCVPSRHSFSSTTIGVDSIKTQDL